MVYAPHVGWAPLEKLHGSPLHTVGKYQSQGNANKGRIIADHEEAGEDDGKRPKKHEATQEPARILDPGQRKRAGIGVLVEAGFCQGTVPLTKGIHLFGGDGRRLTVVVLGKAIRAILKQLLYRSLAALNQCPMQSSESLIVRGIHISPPPQEQVDAGRVALVSCPHERSVTLGVGNVNGYVLMQQQYDLIYVAVEGGTMEEVKALVVSEERVGAVVEQQVDNIVIAAFRSPKDRSCNGIAALCIDRSSSLDQKVAEGVVIIDSSPLWQESVPAFGHDRIVVMVVVIVVVKVYAHAAG